MRRACSKPPNVWPKIIPINHRTSKTTTSHSIIIPPLLFLRTHLLCIRDGYVNSRAKPAKYCHCGGLGSFDRQADVAAGTASYRTNTILRGKLTVFKLSENTMGPLY